MGVEIRKTADKLLRLHMELTAPNPAGSVSSVTRGMVMVVDDNPANLQLMEEMLLSCGYEVRSFPRGRMAMAAATKQPPDLILLDINMPEMTGFEVCEELRLSPQLSGIPVIFLSAMNSAEARLQGFRSGGVDYISKPFQFEEVHARVDAHVRLRQLHRKMQERVQLQIKKTSDAQMETIFAIAKLTEARDDETGGHLERVQSFTRLLTIGLSEDPKYKATIDSAWIRNIYFASPLHDIGKVAIPDRILLKPGPLTAEEFAVMKTHAALGAQTLRAVHYKYPDNEFIEMGIDIAQSHHEWWDGSGYPNGLAGEAIPLCARILAVADCYDAIRSKRHYKSGISHEETCAIILRDSGYHFDPAVIAVFSKLSNVFQDVWTRMSGVTNAGEIGGLQDPDLIALSHHLVNTADAAVEQYVG
jgi:putative two-component system response regulator